MQTIEISAASTPPDALLLIATGCAHCASVLTGLAELIKSGAIGRLEVVNIAAAPEKAGQVVTRSVPWLRIGPFELEGAQTASELAFWAAGAADGTGHARYLQTLLESQQLERATGYARTGEAFLHALLELASDLETPMGVRIGVGAIFEELAADGQLVALIEGLGRLSRSPAVQLRGDAAHYLGLSGSAAARPWLEALQGDSDPEVREIAADSLALLSRRHTQP